jgi:hypothetical protein
MGDDQEETYFEPEGSGYHRRSDLLEDGDVQSKRND